MRDYHIRSRSFIRVQSECENFACFLNAYLDAALAVAVIYFSSYLRPEEENYFVVVCEWSYLFSGSPKGIDGV